MITAFDIHTKMSPFAEIFIFGAKLTKIFQFKILITIHQLNESLIFNMNANFRLKKFEWGNFAILGVKILT